MARGTARNHTEKTHYSTYVTSASSRSVFKYEWLEEKGVVIEIPYRVPVQSSKPVLEDA